MSTEVGAEQADCSPERHNNDRGVPGRRLLTWMTVFAFALPIAAYFWLIHQYAVNVIWGDQWADIGVIAHLRSGSLTLGTLWGQHNEDRIFFSNLLAILLANTTHFNVVIEMYVSAVLLIGATSLLIVTHKLRSASTPWIYYVPVAVMLFSFVQYANTLWGFQVAWYIVLFALAAVIFLLDRTTLDERVLIGAIVAGVVGSFSLFQGFFIWPIGVILLYQRRRKWSLIVTWIIAGATTAAVYFYKFNFQQAGANGISYAIHHPLVALKFFFLAIGEIIPESNNKGLVLGVLIFVIASWLLITCGVRRDARGPRPIGVALICFGLLFALFIAVGRSPFGLGFAHNSIYATYDLLTLVGCYLILIGKEPAQAIMGSSEKKASAVGDGAALRTVRVLTTPTRGNLLVAGVLVIGLVSLQLATGFTHGLNGARKAHAYDLATADLLVNISQASDQVVYRTMVNDPQFVREMAVVAKTQHLSLFATPAAELLRRDPYWVAFADSEVERTVNGVSSSTSPQYPQELTFVPGQYFPPPTVNQNGKPICVHLQTGQLVGVNLGSPGSLRVKSTQLPSLTVEVLFITRSATFVADFEQLGQASSVNFVNVRPTDSWLNIPATRYGALLLEVTSGTALVCQATTGLGN